MTRTVLFVEMPNFYANIERADHPELVDRPIIVGGDPRKKGLVQSATADAIAAGVKLETPVIDAMRHCPEARAFRTNMVRYREVSRQLFAWLRRGVEQLEPFGLAAAFFDLTGLTEPPDEIAKRLQGLVHRELGLPIRAGLGSGKMIARLASEEAGDGAIRQIAAGDEAAFLAPLPVMRLGASRGSARRPPRPWPNSEPARSAKSRSSNPRSSKRRSGAGGSRSPPSRPAGTIAEYVRAAGLRVSAARPACVTARAMAPFSPSTSRSSPRGSRPNSGDRG